MLVLNTESRFDNAETAYRKAYDTGKIVLPEQIKYFYKKLDSTMRGNIGAEISGPDGFVGDPAYFPYSGFTKIREVNN